MRIFLLEDTPSEADAFVASLGHGVHQVQHFACVPEFFAALGQQRPHLVVLDWMLPDGNGLSVLQRVRAVFGHGLPVMMNTCLDAPEQIVQALEQGADDYLTKGTHPSVVAARVEALLRRTHAPGEARLSLSHGPYRLDFASQRLTIDGSPVDLTPKEFDLAWLLFLQPDCLVPRQDISAAVWGKRAEVAVHTFTQHVHMVRKKLRLQEFGYRLSSVYGSGYRLESPSLALQTPLVA